MRLLQTHVLQEAQKQALDLTPRTYEAKPEQKSSKPPETEPQVGLRVPTFVLNGFWLLENRRNHCYANSVLQILHWVIPSVELSLYCRNRCEPVS